MTGASRSSSSSPTSSGKPESSTDSQSNSASRNERLLVTRTALIALFGISAAICSGSAAFSSTSSSRLPSVNRRHAFSSSRRGPRGVSPTESSTSSRRPRTLRGA